MAAEFTCEGCGLTVYYALAVATPDHGFCGVCWFLNETVRPENLMVLRRKLEPGGWELEPRHVAVAVRH